MTEPANDRALEDALRALETPALPATDRAAIRAAIRAAAAQVDGDPHPSRPAGRLPHGWPIVLAVAGLALTAAFWPFGRSPHAVVDAPPTPANAATPVVRTTPVALAIARGGLPSTAPTDVVRSKSGLSAIHPAIDPAIHRQSVAVGQPLDAVPSSDLVQPTTGFRAPTDIPSSAEAPRGAHRNDPSRPTATPGPVLPRTPTGEPPPTPTGAADTAPSPAPSTPSITGIAGTVRLDGAPLAFAAVRAVPAEGSDGAFVVGSSGGDGTFVLRLAPGAWRVVAEGEDQPARWWPGVARVEDATVIVVVAGAVTGGIDFELR